VGEARGAAARVTTTAANIKDAVGKAKSVGIMGVVGAAAVFGFVAAGVLLLLSGASTSLGGAIGPGAAQMLVGGGVVALVGGGAGVAAWRLWPR
jgi:hypothetical protein